MLWWKKKANKIQEEIIFKTIETIKNSGKQDFTVLDVVASLKSHDPDTLKEITNQYGEGGLGAGKHYTAYSRISQYLQKFYRSGFLEKDYKKAPKGYGSGLIQTWSFKSPTNFGSNQVVEHQLDGINEDKEYFEGEANQITVDRYERNRDARQKCIDYYKAICSVCLIDFGKTYGEIGRGFIHVHHLKPMSQIRENYQVDPIKDLRPVCPNCHAMIHRQKEPLTIEELKKIMEEKSQNLSM